MQHPLPGRSQIPHEPSGVRVKPNLSRKGVEVVLGSMPIELFNRQRWRTTLELSLAIADWISHFYNPARRHSTWNYLIPGEFEDLHSTHTQQGVLS